MNWINVKDKLPVIDQEVLVYCIENPFCPKNFKSNKPYFALDKRSFRETGDVPIFQAEYYKVAIVTYWMPLPESPNV